MNKSGSIGLHTNWTEDAPENLKISDGNWSMTLSSPEHGKLGCNLNVSITFSSAGIQWLSEEEVMGMSVLSLLPLADGKPDKINDFLLDDLKGKLVSDVKWVDLVLDPLPSSFSDQIRILRINKANCTGFSWSEPAMDMELDITFTGDVINNGSSVGRSSAELNGSMDISGSTWSRTVDSQFSAIGGGDGWNWGFCIPHLQTMYGSQEYSTMKNQLSQASTDLVIHAIEKADFSNVPGGYQKSGLEYEWAGDEAANALAALISGEGGYSISYSQFIPPPEPDDQSSGNFPSLVLQLTPENAAKELENLPVENVGGLIDNLVRENLGENIGRVLNMMDPAKAALARHSADLRSAVTVTEIMAEENIKAASTVVSYGAKQNLTVEAKIMNRLNSDIATKITLCIFDLPEAPEVATNILAAMKLNKSVSITKTLVDLGEFDYIDGIFSYFDAKTVNGVYRGLTQEVRGTLYPELSREVRDKINEELGPRFRLSNLSLGKRELSPGGTAEITVAVTNTGGTPGGYTVELMVDGATVNDKDVFLEPDQKKAVVFEEPIEEPGTHSVRVADLAENLRVGGLEKGLEGSSSNWIIFVAAATAVIGVVLGLSLYRRRC